MSNTSKELRSLLNVPHQVMRGVVTAVDTSAFTIDIDPDDGGAELLGIPLRGVDDGGDEGVFSVPLVNSIVWFVILSRSDMSAVPVKFDKVDYYIVKTDDIRLGESNLTEAVRWDALDTELKALYDLLAAHTHPTPVGPSGPPVESADFISRKPGLTDLKSQTVTLQ